MTGEKKKWVVKPYANGLWGLYHETSPNKPLTHSRDPQALMKTANELNNMPTRPKNEVKPTRGMMRPR